MQDFLASIAANYWLRVGAGLVSLFVLAWAANTVTRRVFLGVVNRLATRTKSTWDDRIIEHRVFHRLANVAPALVTFGGIAWAVNVAPEVMASGAAAGAASTVGEGIVFAGALSHDEALTCVG